MLSLVAHRSFSFLSACYSEKLVSKEAQKFGIDSRHFETGAKLAAKL